MEIMCFQAEDMRAIVSLLPCFYGIVELSSIFYAYRRRIKVSISAYE